MSLPLHSLYRLDHSTSLPRPMRAGKMGFRYRSRTTPPCLVVVANDGNVKPRRQSLSGSCFPTLRLERAESERLELSSNRDIRPLGKRNERASFVCCTTVHGWRRLRSGHRLNPRCFGWRGTKRSVQGLAWFYSLSPSRATIEDTGCRK
jgi:hypothetical protein